MERTKTIELLPPEKKPEASIVAHYDSIDFVRANENASAPQLVSASHDDYLKVWDIERRTCLTEIHAHREGVFCVDVAPGGKQIASCSPDQTVALWDLGTGAEVVRIRGHTYKVFFVLYVDDNNLLSCGRDKNLFLWDLRNTAEPAKSYGRQDSGTFRSVALDPAKEILIGTTSESTLEVFDFATTERLFKHRVEYDMSVFQREKEWFILPEIIYMARFFRSRNRELLTCHQDYAVRRFTVQDEVQELSILRNHSDFVRGIEIAPNEEFFVSTCQDGAVRVWDAATETPLWSLIGHTQIVPSAVVLKNNRTIITCSYDQTIKFFSI